MLANSAATKARFQEFKARRAAEKEANRLRLAAEFPVLFNNTKKVSTPLHTKRKSLFQDSNENTTDVINDENNSKQANKQVNEKQSIHQTTKIPLSNKKHKKSTTVVSTNNNNFNKAANTIIDDDISSTSLAAKKHESKFNKLQQLIVKCPPQSPMPSSVIGSSYGTGLELTNFSLLNESVGTETFLLEASAEEVNMSHAPSFQSPLAQIEPISTINVEETIQDTMNQVVEESEMLPITMVSEEMVTTTMSSDHDDFSINNQDVALHEQVVDVMDFLLECNEIDAFTHRRLSSLSFSATTLKRLSSSNQPPSAVLVWPRDSLLPRSDKEQHSTIVVEEEESSSAASTKTLIADEQEGDHQCATTTITTSSENVKLEAEDVLVALRNFINSLDHNIIELPQANNTIDEQVIDITSEEAMVPNDKDSSTQVNSVVPTVDIIPSTSQSSSSSSMVALPATIVVNTALQQSSHDANHIMTYPLAEFIEDALVKGLVSVEVLEKFQINDTIQYHVETQIAGDSKVRITSYKRYNDFKLLKSELLEYFKAKHQKLNPPGTPSVPPTESDGVFETILSRLPFSNYRSNRSSSISTTTTSSTSMNRDSMTSNNESRTSQESVYERYATLIPRFPKRNPLTEEQAAIVSTTSDSTATIKEMSVKDIFEEERFKFLQNWILEVYSMQSCKDKEYRIILKKFLTS